MVTDAETPLTLRDIQKALYNKCRLSVSRPFLGKYLRERMNATYRLLKPIKVYQNSLAAKLQR